MTTSTGARLEARPAIALAAAIPPLLLAGVIVVMLAAGLAGRHPMWRTETLNMAEAAAARDLATIAAMLDRGEDPHLSLPIRSTLPDEVSIAMTPLEAGVAAGRLEVVHLLVTRGAALDDGRRAALACEAQRRGYRDVAEYLTAATLAPVCGR